MSPSPPRRPRALSLVSLSLASLSALACVCAGALPGGVNEQLVGHLEPVCQAHAVDPEVPLVRVARAGQPDDVPPLQGDDLHLLLAVTPDRLIVDIWEDLDSPKDLAERLDLSREDLDRSEVGAVVVGLAVAPGTPSARVAEVTRLVSEAGYEHVLFLFESESPLELPVAPDPEVAAEVDDLMGSASEELQLQLLAARMEPLLKLCPAGSETFVAVAVASPGIKCDLMSAGFDEALGSCPMTDWPAVMTVAQAMWTPRSPQVLTAARVSLDPEGEVLLAEGDWDDLAPEVVAREGRAVWFGDAEAVSRRQAAGVRIDGAPMVLGEVDSNEVVSVIADHMEAIEACHLEVVDAGRSAQGRITPKIVIQPDGVVSKASIKLSTMRDRPLEACLMETFGAMRFSPIEGGGIAIVSTPLVFTAP